MVDVRHGDEALVAYLSHAAQEPEAQIFRRYMGEELRQGIVWTSWAHVECQPRARGEVAAPIIGFHVCCSLIFKLLADA